MKAKHIALLLLGVALLTVWLAPGGSNNTESNAPTPKTTVATKRPELQKPSASADKAQSGIRVTGNVSVSLDPGTAVAEDPTRNPQWHKALADAEAQMRRNHANKN